ncbi:hypothetical protein CJ179_37880 [Rhodococcus sp. ACS1]|uniref:hypothetical protein n=1 Tax=Rhodococcus sp. ACS1 TaxID=2028570 RepID=UPI000BB13779|nr:hypothetical protein [Rhodococcus sp. ACS1]PBC39175.1 hypothetical protein CJ179_37880 [Rhodococcus sp. ACS1]
MTTEQCVSDTDGTGQAAMPIHTQTLHDLVAAMCSVDTSDGPLDLDAVARIRQHQFDDWILAAARSGFLTAREIDTLVQSWHADPRSLFDALLANSDDLTRRRYQAIWNSLGTLAAVEYA